MKTLLEYSNYRSYLIDLLSGPFSRRGLQTEFAKAMGCQAAYLSQVLKGKAEITEDHALKLANHLHFSEFDCEYFLLLLRISRAGTPDLVQYLENKRQVMAQQGSELEKKIAADTLSNSEKFLAEYFSSWIPSTIHIATSSPQYQTPTALANRLNLPLEIVEQTLRFLHQSNLIEQSDGKFKLSGGSIHLPRSSALNSTHQINRRIQAMNAIQESKKENLHFSSVFTANPETFNQVRKMLAQYIEDSHKSIHASGSDEIYGMCLDAFQIV